MSWEYPHTVSIVQVVQATVAGIKQPPSSSAPTAGKRADLQRSTPEKVLSDYQVETDEPAVLFAPLSDRALYRPGNIVLRDQEQWLVVAVQQQDAGDELDGVVAILDLIRNPRAL